MGEKMQNVPDHVLVFRAAGKLDAQDIKQFVHQIEAKLAKHEKIGVVSDVTALEGITLSGALEDLRAELAYLGKWHRFPNLAVVAEKGFIKSAAETIGRWLPQVQVRVFKPDEMQQAVAFAAQAGTGRSRST